ncbi:MAG: carotenoid 1,2-hydratase [Gammaproteobacteria bacterium]
MGDPPADFTRAVPDGGYAWWYVDAVSEDGRHGLTVIAFIGSVFSPYYARARRGGDVRAADHVALNVALYGPHGRWAMTERGASALGRSATQLAIGPSHLDSDGRTLVATFDEVAVPWPRRVRGQFEVTPRIVTTADYALDDAARHHWCPRWPSADIEVTLEAPRLHWRGHAYVDHNHGAEPLEAAFTDWHWSRRVGGDEACVRYEARRTDGSVRELGLRFTRAGETQALAAAPLQRLPPSPVWRMPRAARSAGAAAVLRTLEDSPFYARSLVTVEEPGIGPATVVHESLSLARFRVPLVQLMLPFRMPRRA